MKNNKLINMKLSKIRQELLTPKSKDGRLCFHPIFMMHAAAMYGKTYEEFMTDYHVLVDSNMYLLDLYDHDAVSVISDPYRETSAFGSRVFFSGDNFPVVYPIVRTMQDVDNLVIPDVYDQDRTLDRIKGVELFRSKLGNPFPIIGWVEGPLAEAADLMGPTNLLMDLILDSIKVKMLLQKTLHVAKDFAIAQIKAGANIIGIGDAICSQISKEMYDEFCLPLHKELFDCIHENGALVKLHICGDITHLLASLSILNIDILDLDWMVDVGNANIIMGDSVVLSGNLDPVSVVMNGSKEMILQKFKEIKELINPENWIFMAGCEIPKTTPIENVKFMREISSNLN